MASAADSSSSRASVREQLCGFAVPLGCRGRGVIVPSAVLLRSGHGRRSRPTCYRPRQVLRMASGDDVLKGAGQNADDSPPSLEGRDWREVRAALHAGGADALEATRSSASREGFSAFPLAVPEVGCFLASHPAYWRRNHTYLTQAVVFLIRHDKSGSIGLVLNRPLNGTVESLQKVGMFGRSCTLATTVFGQSVVYLGGPDTPKTGEALFAIHGGAKKGGSSEEPLPGVFTSQPTELIPFVESGALKAEDVRLFTGCLMWGPGKLSAEVESGEWFPASGSKDFVLSHCIGLPTPLWKELMCAMSADHKRIARQVYDEM